MPPAAAAARGSASPWAAVSVASSACRRELRLPSMTVSGVGAETSGSDSRPDARAVAPAASEEEARPVTVARPPQTSSPHQAQIDDQPTVRAAHLAHRPRGARRRISSATGPRIAPRTAHQSGLRRRWAATTAAAAPNPMSHAKRTTSSRLSMGTLDVRNGQIPGAAPPRVAPTGDTVRQLAIPGRAASGGTPTRPDRECGADATPPLSTG